MQYNKPCFETADFCENFEMKV